MIASGGDFPREDDLDIPLADGDMEVEDAGSRALEAGIVVGAFEGHGW